MSGSKKGYKGTPEQRFWNKVNKDGTLKKGMVTNCWEWTGAAGQKKYPQINIEGRIIKAVRFSYELKYGEIPEGYFVRHYCANSFCVRPDHLFVTPDRGGWNTKSSPLIEINGQIHKHCSKCGELFPYTIEYFHQVSQNRGLRSYCKNCSRVTNRKNRASNWDYILWVQAKDSAKRLGFEFDITRKFIKELYQNQNGKCFWFGVNLMPSEKPRYPFQPSIDRLDLNKGYTKDNVVLCCYVANIGRNHNTVEEFKNFINALKENFIDA